MPSVETTAAAAATDVNEKIAALKSSAKKAEKRVLPKRGSRASRTSKSSVDMSAESSAESSADESFVSSASSSQEVLEPTECHYLWGCELTRKNDSYVLPFPHDENCEDEQHVITIKSATLGIDAKEDDRNVVEIRYHDHDDKEARAVLASLTLGKLDFCRMDLTISHLAGRDVTLKLIKGSGPVSILGNHLVESFGGHPDDEDYIPDASSAESGTEASGMETDGDGVEADEVKDITEDAKEAEDAKKSK